MSLPHAHPARLPVELLALALLAGTACQRDVPAGAPTDAQATASAAEDAQAAPLPPSTAQGQDDADTTQSGAPPSRIAVPPADTPTAAIAVGARVEYLCEDGNSLVVEYGDASASFRLVGGRDIVLPRAAAATGKGAEVYAGDAAGLQRLGNVVQVEEASGARRTCAEASASA